MLSTSKTNPNIKVISNWSLCTCGKYDPYVFVLMSTGFNLSHKAPPCCPCSSDSESDMLHEDPKYRSKCKYADYYMGASESETDDNKSPNKADEGNTVMADQASVDYKGETNDTGDKGDKDSKGDKGDNDTKAENQDKKDNDGPSAKKARS